MALSKGLPQVEVVGTMDHYPQLPTTVFPGEMMGQPGEDVALQMGKPYNANVAAGFNQLLYSQEYLTGLKAAKTSRSLYELQEVKTVEEVIYQIASLYYQYTISIQKLQTISDNLVRMEELEKITQLMVEQQVALSSDLDRIRVDVTNLRALELQQQAMIDYQHNQLKIVAGLQVTANLSLETLNLQAPVQSTEQALVTDQLTDIRLLYTQLELQKLSEKVVKAGKYPVLAAYGQFAYDAKRDEFNFLSSQYDWFNYSVIGLRLSIPITDGGFKRSKIKQEQIKQLQAKNQIEVTQAQVFIENENARQMISNSLAMLEVQSENTQLAKK
ncbi:MAG: TolC family protein [Marinilabiliaceae bacterium]|nr:TolC family protein [Marinilabiliaceae bacterium]